VPWRLGLRLHIRSRSWGWGWGGYRSGILLLWPCRSLTNLRQKASQAQIVYHVFHFFDLDPRKTKHQLQPAKDSLATINAHQKAIEGEDLGGALQRHTAYLIPSLRLRKASFLRLRSWKPAWTSLMNLLIWSGRVKSPRVTALGARRA
jgi:hypothetical protein